MGRILEYSLSQKWNRITQCHLYKLKRQVYKDFLGYKKHKKETKIMSYKKLKCGKLNFTKIKNVCSLKKNWYNKKQVTERKRICNICLIFNTVFNYKIFNSCMYLYQKCINSSYKLMIS